MKIGVCAHFGVGENLLDGQVIKSRTLLEEIVKKYGEKDVCFCDTRHWKEHPFKLICNCINIAIKSKNVVIMPADNGVRFFPILFILLRIIFNFKLHYVVVGGWLPAFLSGNKWLIFWIRRIDCIYVELHSMKIKLEKLGMDNIFDMIAPNFRMFPVLSKTEIPSQIMWNGKFCYYSRIVKEKGIEDAINSIVAINAEGNAKIILDIYGQIGEAYKDTFKKICKDKVGFINYKGTIDFGHSMNVLKNYTALLFPTYFYGEGFAGVFIDAMAAGLPVIASDWNANTEIVTDKFNGLIFPVHDILGLQNAIKKLYFNPDLTLELKENCLYDVNKYKPNNVLKIFFDQQE